MEEAGQHTFQMLTKRSSRFSIWTRERYSTSVERVPGKRPWPSHVWAGVSVETQEYVWRIKDLLHVPADVRFLSVEPLLGPVKIDLSLLKNIHWVIVGGESGPRARPMKPEWVYFLREQCQTAGVKFFFKQWGAYTSEGRRVGKKAAGRLLDGRTWDDMPACKPSFVI